MSNIVQVKVAQEDVYVPETGMSDAQAMGLLLATTFTGSLSLFGSGFIVYTVLSKREERRKPVNRFLLAVSIYGMIATVAFIGGCFFMPSETGLPFSYGNTISCELFGAMGSVLTAVILSSCGLSFYFLLTIKYRWTDEQVRRYEIYLHTVIPIVCTLFMMVSALTTNAYNPNPLLRSCGLEYYPLECDMEDDIECTRGTSTSYLYYFQTIIGVVPAGIGAWNTFVVYRFVHTTIKNCRFEGAKGSRAEERQRNMTIQAVLYMASFLNSFLWIFIVTASAASVRMKDAGGPFYFLLFLTHLFLPMQGLFNFIIFLRKSFSGCGFMLCWNSRNSSDEENGRKQPETEIDQRQLNDSSEACS